VRTWDINEPIVSDTQHACVPSATASDKTDVDADVVVRQGCELHTRLAGLLRKVVWPISDISAFCCASDECYL